MALTDHYVLWSWALVLMVIATGPDPIPLLSEYSNSQLRAAVGLLVYRNQWIPVLENILPVHAYDRIRPTTFEDEIEAGLK
jgi:hypothetical protein